MPKDILQVQLMPNTEELIIREGQAAEIEQNTQIFINCELTSLSSFISKRIPPDYQGDIIAEHYQVLIPNTSIIHVERNKGLITLNLSPSEPRGTVINGSLSLNPDLEQFSINKPVTFSRESLAKLIRFNRRFFSQLLTWEETLKALQTVTISGNIEINQSSDTRGNKGQQFNKQLTTSVPLSFNLTMPIYNGTDPVTFNVEICLESTESAVKFWLESPELMDLKENIKNLLFDKVLAPLKENFVILYQ